MELANHFGISPHRKEEIYADVSRSAASDDPTYWLQILFSAGIATLGLALNSPAVIIGAMLISPLMGPILAAGLALAAGDLELGVRALIKLVLSCLIAVAFAVLLVALLPFKEVTAEIAARTQPTTLDLFVALFAGLIGSVAICKEVKGVVTSIPGVAIAVALMPPLCVVGYGLGVALSLDGAEGLRVARGGGLLFLTNLVAITFTAMMTFVALRITARNLRQHTDLAMGKAPGILARLPGLERLGEVGSLLSRIILLVALLLLLWLPLSKSFAGLRSEITSKQAENRLQATVTGLWRQRFAKLANGRPRSYVRHLSAVDRDGRLDLELQVFTKQRCTQAEKNEFVGELAQRLARTPASLILDLAEIPLASDQSAPREPVEKAVKPPPTAAQLQADLLRIVDAGLRDLPPPPPAGWVGFQVELIPDRPYEVKLLYLSDHDFGPDARYVLARDAAQRLGASPEQVSLERIEPARGPLKFARGKADLAPPALAALDEAGQLLQRYPTLRAGIAAGASAREGSGIAAERAAAVESYLATRWRIEPARLATSTAAGAATAGLTLHLAAAGPVTPLSTVVAPSSGPPAPK